MQKVAWESLCVFLGRSVQISEGKFAFAEVPTRTDNIPKAQCAPGGLSLLHGTVLADKVKGNGRASSVASRSKGGRRFMCRIKGQRSRMCDSARQRPLRTSAVCVSQERTIWPRWQVARK